MEQAIVIDNIDAVRKRVGNAGFGNRFDKDIDEALASGKTEIRLFTSEMIENKKMDFEPEIKINEGKGYYNGFKGTLHHVDGTTMEQWFKASDRITMNEAYILMMDQQHPRAVHKTYYDETGEKYGQWVQLDFTQKTDSGNHLTKRFGDFDLVGKLNDFVFVELSTEKQKITAAACMAEGREVELTPVNQEQHKLIYVRANPERNTVTFMDTAGKLLYHDQFRTEEARRRIQQEKNTRESSVNLTRDTLINKVAATIPLLPEVAESLNKKNTGKKPNTQNHLKKTRVVQESENKKGKRIS